MFVRMSRVINKLDANDPARSEVDYPHNDFNKESQSASYVCDPCRHDNYTPKTDYCNLDESVPIMLEESSD